MNCALEHDAGLDDLLGFYSNHDGLRFGSNPLIVECGESALELLPLAALEEASTPLRTGGALHWLVEDSPFYQEATWKVFARVGSESTLLTVFFDGEHEGSPLAGQIFYVSLDPVLSGEDPVAPSIGEFLNAFTSDPARLLRMLGWTAVISGADGDYADEPEAYLPDIREHKSLVGPARVE